MSRRLFVTIVLGASFLDGTLHTVSRNQRINLLLLADQHWKNRLFEKLKEVQPRGHYNYSRKDRYCTLISGRILEGDRALLE